MYINTWCKAPVDYEIDAISNEEWDRTSIVEMLHGILILSGYHNLPQLKLYWSSHEDKGVQFVKIAMSRNRFLDIK